MERLLRAFYIGVYSVKEYTSVMHRSLRFELPEENDPKALELALF